MSFFTIIGSIWCKVSNYCGSLSNVLLAADAVPDYPSWLVFLRDFQTLIGGSLAFIGVLLVIRSGNKGLRTQLKQAEEAESLRVENEGKLDRDREDRFFKAKREAIEGAIFAEISTIRDFLEAEQNQARKFLNPAWKFLAEEEEGADENLNPEDDLSLPLVEDNYPFAIPDRDVVFRGLINEVSAIEPESVKLVIKAYDRFYSFRSWLKEADCSENKNTEMVELKSEDVRPLISEIQDTLNELNFLFSAAPDPTQDDST